MKRSLGSKITLNEISLFNIFLFFYAPWQPRGLERETTDLIIDLCALGRSYGLSIVILSQGMAGEIGLNAAVRRNLNT